MADNGELMFQLVDEIISKKLEGISFDQTITATIVEDKDKEQGKYVLSNNAYARFEAYSSDNSYSKGTTVYVTIPNGNWDNEKIIIGKHVSKNSTPFIYTPPKSKMIDLTSDILKGKNNKGTLAANGKYSEVQLYTWQKEDSSEGDSSKEKYSNYSRLCISAKFQSWTKEAVMGSYGLCLEITDDKNHVYKLYLSNQDMYGNPYNFQTYILQQKLFNIEEISNISKMVLNFYQSNDFKDINNKELYKDKEFNNLFVKDIEICLGDSIENFEDDKLILSTLGQKTFSNETSVSLNLKWVHKYDDGTIKIVENYGELLKERENVDDSDFIKFYHYKLGAPSVDGYSGVYWESIDSKKSFNIEVTLDANQQTEEFKAIIKYGDKILRSNILIFQNEKKIIDTSVISALEDLKLVAEDSTYGNYFLYKINNEIMDSNMAQQSRTLSPYYQDTPLNIAFGEEEYSVEWEYPNDLSYSMYSEIIVGDTLKYKLKPYFSQSYTNNLIKCIATIKGVKYYANFSPKFGIAGSSGIDHTFILNFKENNKTSLNLDAEIPIEVEAHLYNFNNEEVNITTAQTLSWELINNETEQIILNTEKNFGTVELFLNKENNTLGLHYTILKATLKGWGDYDLEAYLPIPIKKNEAGYISGIEKIVYNADGSLIDYYQDVCKIFDPYGEEIEAEWTIKSKSNNDTPVEDYIVFNKNKNNQTFLRPASFYVIPDNEYFCAIAKKNNEIIWVQPLLIEKQKYPSTQINAWGGETDINTEKNAIFTANLVAGKKDAENKFTGAVIGEIGKIIDGILSDKQAGIYGFSKGENTFAFKEDGTAFIGSSGGRINFDGKNALIKSSNPNGLIIDLGNNQISTSGNFTLSSNNLRLSSNAPYFQIQAEDSQKNLKTLIDINQNNYILQSLNYTENTGMKLDLSTGSLIANTGKFSGDILLKYHAQTETNFYTYTRTESAGFNEMIKFAKYNYNSYDRYASLSSFFNYVDTINKNLDILRQSVQTDFTELKRFIDTTPLNSQVDYLIIKAKKKGTNIDANGKIQVGNSITLIGNNGDMYHPGILITGITSFTEGFNNIYEIYENNNIRSLKDYIKSVIAELNGN